MGSWEGPAHGQLELLNLTSWEWETKQPYFTAICRFATLYYDDSMFVFGGKAFSRRQNYPISSIQSYNPKTNIWTDRGNLFQTHNYHDVIFSSGRFLILGDQSSHKSEECVFDGISLVCQELWPNFGSVQ